MDLWSKYTLMFSDWFYIQKISQSLLYNTNISYLSIDFTTAHMALDGLSQDKKNSDY